MAPAYNDKPCDTCQYFDTVMRGDPKGGLRETNWAWCVKKSKYPFKEGPGQKFPAEAVRVAEGEAAVPVIVKRGNVVSHCNMYTARGASPTKADLLKQLQAKAGNVITGH